MLPRRTEPETPAGEGRHWFLSLWLILLALANLLTAIGTPLSIHELRERGYAVSPVFIWVITGCALANVLFAVLLWRWRRVGFYGIVVTSLMALGVNLAAGFGIAQALSGLAGVVILFVLLNLGGARSAWRRLR
jgi:hypothetical protein